MNELDFITHNKHKYIEATQIAEEYNVVIKWLNIEYEEIQDNQLENIAKASCESLIRIKPELHKRPFFVEDAGLFISALNGFPGPYSAYVFQTIGNDLILELMKNKKNREAHFKSVVAYYNKEEISLFIGITDGEILFEKSGDKGFGFDPIFKPKDSEKSFANMSLTTKNLYSHRQKSLREMFTSLTAFENKTTSGE